jgi:CRP-like cAMP-binding protein
MYVIDSGRVSIVKKIGDSDIILTTLDEGDYFGEMALITGSKRSRPIQILNATSREMPDYPVSCNL